MKKEWIVTQENHQCRVDDFAFYHHISKKALKDIKMKGDILVNGIHQTVRYVLHEGDCVTFLFPDEVNHMEPYDYPLRIVYEDDDLLVIDKEAGMPCIPTKAHPRYTLANAITSYYQRIGLQATVHLVNRLDKGTRGLMIVAKDRYIHDLMNQQHIYRIYRAHVSGEVTQGDICLPIFRDGLSMRRIIDERGKPSYTKYRSLPCGWVEFMLKTGRTHQIRVHMASIGHPLRGDTLYGDGKGEFDLESYKIAFEHPVTHRCFYIEKRNARHSF